MKIRDKRNSYLRENAMKDQCIDFLLRHKRQNDDDVFIINELPFRDGKRRADLVKIDDFLHAYEIKSDLDTLNRLPEQMLDYKENFNTLTIVTTKQHLGKVRYMCTENVGLLLLKDSTLHLIRKATLRKKIDSFLLASFLITKELDTIAREIQIKGFSKMDVTQKRITIAEKNKASCLKAFVLKMLKDRYLKNAKRPSQKSFQHTPQFSGQHTSLDDISFLDSR